MQHPSTASYAKRSLDVAVAAGSLLVLAPALALALALAAVSTGAAPVFRQERIGLGGAPFTLLKIRTMRPVGGSTTTTAGDPRVTRVGALLRATKVDELPQLVNVLRGEMSLVGPRPTVADDVARMTGDQRRRLQVRPGLTGLAQISGNTSLRWPARIELDLRYVDEWSLRLDATILARTVALAVRGQLATDPEGTSEW